MIRYSSLNYVALLHSLLANVSARRSRKWGTIAAVVRRRPPWFIVFWQTSVFGTSKHTDSYNGPIIDASKKNCNYLQYLPLVASYGWDKLLVGLIARKQINSYVDFVR